MTAGKVQSGRATARRSSRRTYTRPPVKEAVLQIRWENPIPWSIAMPGMIYSALRREYPSNPEPQQEFSAEIELANPDHPNLKVLPNRERILYRSDDGSKVFIAAPDGLAVSSLPPYEGWDSLRHRLQDAIRSLEAAEVIEKGANVVQGVNLRYINQLLVAPDAKVEEFFHIQPPRPAKESAVVTNFLTQIESNLEKDVTCTTVFSKSVDSGRAAYLLDLDLKREIQPPLSVKEALGRDVAGALKELEAYEFEGAITDAARSLFK